MVLQVVAAERSVSLKTAVKRRMTVVDSKKNRGKADRARVSASEPYEVYYVARKYRVSADTVRKVIKKVGNSRAKVYAALEKM
jgi:hypothetical protein